MKDAGINTSRWGIAAAGFVMQMALGAVYAWSVFRIPLAKQFHWSIEQVALTFTISIFVLGLACFFGGLWLNRKGPRVVALTGGFLQGLGVFLASFSAHKLGWLSLTGSSAEPTSASATLFPSRCWSNGSLTAEASSPESRWAASARPSALAAGILQLFAPRRKPLSLLAAAGCRLRLRFATN